MTRRTRILAVTGGLIATGVVVGAVCGVVALWLWEVRQTSGIHPDYLLAAISAIVGGLVGGVTAPLLAWGLMRRVPLGRAIGYSALGTIIGGTIGMIVAAPLGAILGGIAGFVVAAAILSVRHSVTPDAGRVLR